ncbi:cation-dependent mannose-6-phosphate receptor-like [Saccoglossus kowalevskii]
MSRSCTSLVYDDKQGEANKITVVTVKCTESVEHHLHVYKQARPDRYNMTLESPYGCLQRIKPFINKRTIGPGAVIILIFLVVIFLYCGLGCVIKRAIYNAKGADQVPHYEFWMSLPGLIKDGCAFVAGCCQAKQPQHNYDQM